MQRLIRPTQRFFLFCLMLFVLDGCLDEDIEGASTSASLPFKASKVTSSFASVNTCTLSNGSLGTSFSFRIDLQGNDIVDFVDGSYKFSTQSSFTNINSFTFVQTGGSSSANGGLRQPVSSTNQSNYITITSCVRFGTSTSIEYKFNLTNEDFETSTITLLVQKPTGAN